MVPRQTKVKVRWDDILARRAAEGGVQDGLEGAAALILEASNQLVPFDTGALMGTGQVDFDLDAETASVYYDTPYAVRVHQNPRFRFQGGRRGRYLANATSQGKTRVASEFEEKMTFRFRRRSKLPPLK